MHRHQNLLTPSEYIHPAPHYYYPHPHTHQNPWVYNYPVVGAGVRESFALASGLAEVWHKHDKFTVKLDVGEYSPDELVVKTVEDSLIIEGSHEEKQDKHGFITRSFKRRFPLPSDVNKDDLQIECEIGTDGMLTVTVPLKVSAGGENEKIHPIKKINV